MRQESESLLIIDFLRRLNLLYFDFCHSTVFPGFLRPFVKTKRALPEPATSAAPSKRSSALNNTVSFTSVSIPPHYYHLGEENYAAVSDFGDVINVHIRKFRTDENGRIFPIKNGVSFSPFVWEPLVTEMDNASLPSDTGKVVIVKDTLFLSTAWIEDKPFISFQRYVMKQDFSRQFLPFHSLISEREWNQFQCIKKKISESCKSLMFGNFQKKKILSEVSSQFPRTNLQIELNDVEMLLSTFLKEILQDNIKSRIDDVLVCKGCLENQANQLVYECVTMNFESRHSLYGDLAILSMDIELLVKEFVEKNIQMLNYINETVLNNLNIDLPVKNACDMYIASDTMPHRMF
ncbi:hypothetical protein AVEN_169927-1 [Araneus ventricosus]|uniref:Uncharacterized protein n=1 Tax=Araneus ventricosus TaxID=182803 RepID=A0A4Y2EVZ2_ARAVE|nr:hypothetical protein AVEN_169927-1 [Araneus ventricosus]